MTALPPFLKVSLTEPSQTTKRKRKELETSLISKPLTKKLKTTSEEPKRLFITPIEELEEEKVEEPIVALPRQFGWTYDRTFWKRYRLTGKLLGKGSYGKVMLAEHIESGEKRAIKILVFIPRFANELSALEVLSYDPNCHPNIVCYYEHAIVTDPTHPKSRYVYAIVMEYVPGLTLKDYEKFWWRKKRIAPTPAILTRLLVSALEALVFVHGKNIAHRDMKPENIMVIKDQNIKLIDFGLACFRGACDEPVGSPLFMSPTKYIIYFTRPKQRFSFIEEKANDIWGLGVSLYEFITKVSFMPKIVRTEEDLFNIHHYLAKQKNFEPSTWTTPTKEDDTKQVRAFIEQQKRFDVYLKNNYFHTQILYRSIKAMLNPVPERRPDAAALLELFN